MGLYCCASTVLSVDLKTNPINSVSVRTFHVPWLDALVTGVVLLCDLPFVLPWFSFGVPLKGVVGLVCAVGMCAPWLARRRFPLGSFLVSLGFAIVQVLFVPLPVPGSDVPLNMFDGVVTPLPSSVMVVFGVYNVASRSRWLQALIAALLALSFVGVVAAWQVRAGWLSRDAVMLAVMLIGWVWGWGLLVGSLRERNRRLERERDIRVRLAVVGERTRIAREIHDAVSHSLVSMTVMAEAAGRLVDSDPAKAGKVMSMVSGTGRAATADIRRVLTVLRDDDTSTDDSTQPSLVNLDALVARARTGGVDVELTVRGERRTLPTGLDAAAYRIVQESLTNAVKHGGPSLTRIEVTLDYGGDALTIHVDDDGAGPKSHHDGGFTDGGRGLIGMRERVDAYDGTLRFGPGPRGGFEVIAVLPFDDAHDRER
ncbi:sensor histidine kinase [Bifidobacterium sp. SMA15]|uniref:histidine kinase n=1 Tax=Bifidobacterium platyrrhinorum TaxID=2661628 RepID=A0A6L9SS90_9BIFI|nr:sensor histidine kinase [Bifidobacterium platyrrhinorum]